MENTERECLECGDPISAPFLSAHPNAKRCLECETKREKQPKIISHEKAEKVKKRRKGGSRGGHLGGVTEIG